MNKKDFIEKHVKELEGFNKHVLSRHFKKHYKAFQLHYANWIYDFIKAYNDVLRKEFDSDNLNEFVMSQIGNVRISLKSDYRILIRLYDLESESGKREIIKGIKKTSEERIIEIKSFGARRTLGVLLRDINNKVVNIIDNTQNLSKGNPLSKRLNKSEKARLQYERYQRIYKLFFGLSKFKINSEITEKNICEFYEINSSTYNNWKNANKVECRKFEKSFDEFEFEAELEKFNEYRKIVISKPRF